MVQKRRRVSRFACPRCARRIVTSAQSVDRARNGHLAHCRGRPNVRVCPTLQLPPLDIDFIGSGSDTPEYGGDTVLDDVGPVDAYAGDSDMSDGGRGHLILEHMLSGLPEQDSGLFPYESTGPYRQGGQNVGMNSDTDIRASVVDHAAAIADFVQTLVASLDSLVQLYRPSDRRSLLISARVHTIISDIGMSDRHRKALVKALRDVRGKQPDGNLSNHMEDSDASEDSCERVLEKGPISESVLRLFDPNFVERIARDWKIPTLPVLSAQVYFGKGLHRTVPASGFHCNIVYRDVMSVIARRTLAILSLFGPDAFRVRLEESGPESYETAQQARYNRRVHDIVQRVMGLPNQSRDGPEWEVLVIPVKILSDEAHMRMNGLHRRTPISVSVVHRARFVHDHSYPDVVAFMPHLSCDELETQARVHQRGQATDGDDIIEVQESRELGSPTSRRRIVPVGLEGDIDCCLHHSVLHFLFRYLLTEGWMGGRPFSFPVQLGAKRYRCVPYVYKLGMDMPMMAKVSYVKNSRPMQQDFPCQQCLAPGRDLKYFLSDPSVQYRVEKHAVAEALTGTGPHGRTHNVRRLGEPVFAGLDMYDERGIFLLAGADALHAFKKFWMRDFLTMGMDLIADWDRRKLPSASSVPSGGYFKDPDVAKRMRNISNTATGRKLRDAAHLLDVDLRTRGQSVHVPFRRARNVFDEMSQFVENKYSLGIFLRFMVILTCDDSDAILDQRSKAKWVRVAVLVITVYCHLYARKPTEEDIQHVRLCTADLLEELAELRNIASENVISFAPKIHLLTHFADTVSELGRVRLWDTVDGESVMKYIKRKYLRVGNRATDRWEYSMLRRMEMDDRLHFMNTTLEGSLHMTLPSVGASLADTGPSPTSPSCSLFGYRGQYTSYLRYLGMEQNILGVFASLPDYGVPPRYHDGETLGRHIRDCLLRFVRDNIVLPLQGRGISMQNISIDIRHTLRTLYWGGRKETYECRRKSDGGKRYDIVAVTPESGCPRPCIGEMLLFLKISYTTCPVNVQAAEYPNARMTVEHNPTEWNVAVVSPWNLCALDSCYCIIASPVLHHLVADDTLDNLLCIRAEHILTKVCALLDVNTHAHDRKYFCLDPCRLLRVETYV